MASKKGNMKRKLCAAKVEWPVGRNSHFIPVSNFNEIMQLPDIEEELESVFPGETDTIRKSVALKTYLSAKQLLAILVCGGQQSIFLDLLEEDVTDKDLPFTRIDGPSIPGGYARKFKLARKDHSSCQSMDHASCGIQALEKLDDPEDRTAICRNQWLVLAPIFRKMEDSRRILHLELDIACILPFTEEKKEELKQGGYSDVWPVQIHPAHQEFLRQSKVFHHCQPIEEYEFSDSLLQDPWFAVKKLHLADTDKFNAERRMLTTLTSLGHLHLVKLFATWRFNGEYYMLFPYASGNLQMYWEENSAPPRAATTWLWAITQIRGLAWALKEIHTFEIESPLPEETINPQITLLRPRITGPLRVVQSEERYGRHGDLKPENILFFRDLESTDELGRLQIADFGLSRFHQLESRSKVPAAGLNYSPTYSPPEIYLETPVSRAYDIWSLGCVYLQFITWLLEGYAGYQKFADTRTEMAPDGIRDDLFYSQLQSPGGVKEAKLRNGVDTWINQLRQNPACSGMLEELLDLVQNKMLRIEIVERIDAQNLDICLAKMEQKARDTRTYLLGTQGSQTWGASEIITNGIDNSSSR